MHVGVWSLSLAMAAQLGSGGVASCAMAMAAELTLSAAPLPSAGAWSSWLGGGVAQRCSSGSQTSDVSSGPPGHGSVRHCTPHCRTQSGQIVRPQPASQSVHESCSVAAADALGA